MPIILIFEKNLLPIPFLLNAQTHTPRGLQSSRAHNGSHTVHVLSRLPADMDPAEEDAIRPGNQRLDRELGKAVLGAALLACYVYSVRSFNDLESRNDVVLLMF